MKKILAAGAALLLSSALTLPAAALSHTVAKGDTLWKLAVKYEVGTREIIDANPQVQNPDLMSFQEAYQNHNQQPQVDNLISWLNEQNIQVHVSKGEYQTVLGFIGDTSNVDVELIEGLDIIQSVTRITEPFKSANRKFHPENTVVDISGIKIGGGNFALIAGPCSVESEEQIIGIANAVKASGATLLRGGAFKPRTSPYDFQGLKAEGIDFLLEAKEITGMPIVTEIMNANHLELFENVDVIQVGARNMQNFELLKELGKTDKTILLKRGLANTLKVPLCSGYSFPTYSTTSAQSFSKSAFAVFTTGHMAFIPNTLPSAAITSSKSSKFLRS